MFNINQKVICIDNSGIPPAGVSPLELNKIYTVRETTPKGIRLQEIYNGIYTGELYANVEWWYWEGRFGLIQEEISKNNKNSEECRASTMVAWERVNALITDGKLRGNGTDKTAERNGLIIAANIIAEVIREEGSYDTQDRGKS